MTAKDGWQWKSASGRRHYFVDGLSLCGMWIMCRHKERYTDEPDKKVECAICRRILDTGKRQAA